MLGPFVSQWRGGLVDGFWISSGAFSIIEWSLCPLWAVGYALCSASQGTGSDNTSTGCGVPAWELCSARICIQTCLPLLLHALQEGCEHEGLPCLEVSRATCTTCCLVSSLPVQVAYASVQDTELELHILSLHEGAGSHPLLHLLHLAVQPAARAKGDKVLVPFTQSASNE